jgi:hypothetical protein
VDEERENGGRARGPRGGRTTVTTSGMVKKNLWIPGALADELRQRAFEERRSEAEILREALRRHLRNGGAR